MKLNKLIVTVNEIEVRNVTFHDGLNLITNRPGAGRTGNSVGKSTLSRVVNYLFLGAVENIYIDEEFQKPNKEIEALFRDNNVIASLSFFDRSMVLHEISRNFSINNSSEVNFWVNGKAVSSKEYECFVKESIFNIYGGCRL